MSLTIERPRTPVAELVGIDQPFWWVPNLAGLRRTVRAAGFEIVKAGGPFIEPNGPGMVVSRIPVTMGELRLIPRRVVHRLGALHVWMLTRPR